MKKTKKKEKTDFDRIVWSDDLLDKILSGCAAFVLSGIIILLIVMFFKI